MTRALPGLTVFLTAAVLCTAFSEEIVAPARVLLPEGPVEIKTVSADLTIRWDAEEQPTLDFWWSPEESPGRIMVGQTDQGSTVESVTDFPVDGRALIEIHLISDQPVSFDLNNCSVDAMLENNSDEPNPTLRLVQGNAVDTEFILTGLPGVHLTGDRSSVFSTGGSGKWEIGFVDGSFEFEEHSGELTHSGTDCEAELLKGNGKVILGNSGGFFRISDLQGFVTGHTNGGSVSIENSAASINVTAESSSIALYDIVTPTVSLKGQQLSVNMTGGKSSVRLEIDGGDLSADSWEGRFDVKFQNLSSASITDLRGDLRFTSTDSFFELYRPQGHTRGVVTRGSLNAEDLQSLELDAAQADITINRAKKLNKLSVTNSTVYAYLPDLREKRSIQLRGASEARVTVSMPCQVKYEGKMPSSSHQASITGCELIAPGKNWRRPGRRINQDAPKTVYLGILLGKEARVDIVGE